MRRSSSYSFYLCQDLKDEVNSLKQQKSGVDCRGNTVCRVVWNVISDFEEFVDENIDASENDYYFASTS